MKTTVQAPIAPANLSAGVHALNLLLFGPDLEKANDLRIPAFDDIGKALEFVNLFSRCMTYALKAVCGANKVGAVYKQQSCNTTQTILTDEIALKSVISKRDRQIVETLALLQVKIVQNLIAGSESGYCVHWEDSK